MAAEGVVDDWLDDLARLEDDAARGRFFETWPRLRRRETLAPLHEEVVKALRQDHGRARALAAAGHWLARDLDDPHGLAASARALGNVHYVAGQYDRALEHYTAAVLRFQAMGAEVEAAITLSSSIHAQILLGRHTQALAAARFARRIFERHRETLLLGRLDSNEAQIYMRQGRLDEAIARYTKVLEVFRRDGEPQDVAAALYNLAVCYIGVYNFAKALAVYRRLADHCRQHAMRPVLAQADYNIAYLHFLRGDYIRALELYRRARKLLEEVDDPYHRALCDLDQAEIYLELNLTTEGERLAGAAFAAFSELGSDYEAGKALAFQAIAAWQSHQTALALDLFDQARRRFERGDNRVWLAMIDLYQALLCESTGDLASALRLATRSMERFDRYQQAGKVVLAEVLLARIELLEGRPEAARARSLEALERLESLDSPRSAYLAHFVLGKALEALDESREALESYREAQKHLESLRSRLRGEDLKIAFLRDKNEIYENLFRLTLEQEDPPGSLERALGYMEQAKSRTLGDRFALRVEAFPATRDPILSESLRRQREELDWTYREIDLLELRRAEQTLNAPLSPETLRPATYQARLRELRQDRSVQERRLLASLAELSALDTKLGSLHSMGSLDPGALQAAVPDGSLLLEYFSAGDTLYVALLDRQNLRIRSLGSLAAVRRAQQYLSFELSRFRLQPSFLESFGAAIHRATLRHLGALYSELVAPIEEELSSDRWIVVPHGPLHFVPFHALWDGESFLLDRVAVSYAPSASVFAMCSAKPPTTSQRSLVLGAPDELNPQIRNEAESVAASIPNAELYLGESATEERLRTVGPDCRLIHIAAHGFSRLDNPMFSAIQLGTSRLTLYDLYQLELEADLVVLSGCATGHHDLDGGDEMIGLTRGLLSAGARSALVSLWQVHDASTATFMTAMYRHLGVCGDGVEAVRRAMREVREDYPHPYYWAPFVVIGKPFKILDPHD